MSRRNNCNTYFVVLSHIVLLSWLNFIVISMKLYFNHFGLRNFTIFAFISPPAFLSKCSPHFLLGNPPVTSLGERAAKGLSPSYTLSSQEITLKPSSPLELWILSYWYKDVKTSNIFPKSPNPQLGRKCLYGLFLVSFPYLISQRPPEAPCTNPLNYLQAELCPP